MSKKRSYAIKVIVIALAALLVLGALPISAERGWRKQTETEREDGMYPGGPADFEPSKLIPFDGEKYVWTRENQRSLKADYSTVRVLITVGSVSSVKLDLVGGFYIAQNNASVTGTETSPKQLTLTASGGKITASVGGTALYTGTTVDVNRVSLAEAAGYLTLTTSGYSFNSGRKYLGNMRVSANSNGTIRLVNVIPTAHYLYGIVPYELSEGCSIEALKAQAVAAKSYAFGFTLAGDDYDVTDSFNYQGYRGYTPGYTKCMLACLSVRGKLLTYNGTVPLIFYGATNGGETALPSFLFGYPQADAPFEVKLDDVDVSAGASRRQTLKIEYGKPITDAKFKALLELEAGKVVGSSVEAVSVTSAEVNTPAHQGVVRDLTNFKVTLKVKSGGKESSVTCNFPVKYLKSSGIFTASYKIYWGKAVTGGYEVYFCRHGHGLGMSQLGADGYAKLGYDYKYILNFYFSKMKLVDVNETNPESAVVVQTPVLAFGSINQPVVRLRSGPSTSTEILDRLYLGQHVDIIGEQDDWLFCNVNGMSGYVRGDLIDIKLVPSALGAQQSIGKATVLPGGPFAAKVGPSAYAEEAFALTAGAEVEIWSKIGSWYHARINGAFAFVSASSTTAPTWTTVSMHRKLR